MATGRTCGCDGAGKAPRRFELVRLIPAVLVLLSTGCLRFQPAVPMRAQTADIELELANLRLGLSPQIVLTARSSAPHVIERGYLTVPTRAPCTGGADMTSIAIDGQPAKDGVLPAGTHTLRIESADRMNGYTLDIVADIVMTDGTCARTPVLSQSIPLNAEPRVVLVAGVGALGNTTLAGVKASADFQIGAGGTVGPVLVTAHFGVGTAQCVASLCGPGDDGKAKVATALGGALTAIRGFPLPGEALRGSLLTLGARYSFFTVRLPALAASQRVDFHSVQALIGWGVGAGLPERIRGRGMTPVIDFAFPIGVMAEQSALSQVAFVGGVELRMLLDL